MNMSRLAVLFMGMSIVFLLVFVVVWAIDVAGNWLILRKAGEAGWKALIPIYSTYVQYKLFWSIKPFYIWLAMVIFVYGAQFMELPGILLSLCSLGTSVMYILYCIRLARSFGKGTGFTLGLVFLPFIFNLILGLDSSRYQGPSN